LSEGKIKKMSQPHLIDAILQDVGLPPKDLTRRIPGQQIILGCDLKGDDFDGRAHYHAVVGKLNLLEKGSRPKIAYSEHQRARFSKSLKLSRA
jgi:hypothetical protein